MPAGRVHAEAPVAARLIPARGSDRSDDSLVLAEDHLQQDFRGNGVVHGDDEALFDRLLGLFILNGL